MVKRIVVAMSGGVDSSVAAWLLRREGHELIGLFMRHGLDAPEDPMPPAISPCTERQGCASAADAADAHVLGHEHVVEGHLVELVRSIHIDNRAHLGAG